MTSVVVAAALRPAVGERVCGDGYASIPRAGGLLLCLADGLGHGPAAKEASDLACKYAQEHADDPLEQLMRGLDAALTRTRGAAVSLLVLEPANSRVQFVGVGNVDLRALSRSPITPPTTPGIVGHGLRKVRVWEYALAAGDLVLLMSDGISSRFDLSELAHLAPQALADSLLATHHKSHDDGCCVVARVASSLEEA